MRRDRFWFGTGLVVVPLVLILLAIVPCFEVKESGPVEGHVSVHGRPLAGGYILFYPEGPQPVQWMITSIDENGHFTTGCWWHREDMKGMSGFRICLRPNPRQTSPAPDGARTPTMNVASGLPRRLSNPATTNLEVQLDSGPAHLDIAL